MGSKSMVASENYSDVTVDFVLETLKRNEWIGVDTETTGLDPNNDKITSLQLGDKDNQFFIDCRVVPIANFKGLLEGKNLIFHNAKFDYKFLKAAGINVENLYDTMLAECVIYSGYESFGYSLKDLCKRYLDVELNKEVRGQFVGVMDEPFTDAQILYGAADVAYLHAIKELQQILIERYDLTYCVNLENEAVKALADIEYNGMHLNQEKWLSLTGQYGVKREDTRKKLDELISSEPKLEYLVPKYVQSNLFDFEERSLEVNYASSKQMKEICHSLGFYISSTNDKELSKLEGKHPFFELLRQDREYSKVISTYGSAFLDYVNPATGRVHTDFWQIKSTGRVSSSNPNVQNLPADNAFRNTFEPRRGYLWVSGDYTGQELMLMADLSNEQVFIEALNNKEDLHCKSASLLFGRTITKADKAERTAAKTITFGLAYGMGYKKLADTLLIGDDEAKELMDKFNSTFPTVTKWLTEAGNAAKVNSKAVTQDICKRIRWFPDIRKAKELRQSEDPDWRSIMIIEGATEREGKNHLIQGSAASITKEALVEVRRLISQVNTEQGANAAYLICTVHDQIDVEVLEPLAEQFAKDMKRIMIDCGNKYVTKVKMDVDMTITNFWSK